MYNQNTLLTELKLDETLSVSGGSIPRHVAGVVYENPVPGDTSHIDPPALTQHPDADSDPKENKLSKSSVGELPGI